MFYQIKSYISFLLSSKNQHGIHSPFVFDLVTKCFCSNQKQYSQQFNQIENYRNSLSHNHNIIEVKDFGAGSKVFKSNNRKVSAIAKNAGITKERAGLLIKITQYFKPKKVLEIGSSLGIGTASLSIGNPKSEIITLEGCPETSKIAQNYFTECQFENIKLIVGDFKNTLPQVLNNQKFDLIYFDGNHQKDATINYFEQCLPTSNNNSVFIFDDIHWNNEMEEAWNYIKNHIKVTVSIDTYQWGIVFFRKEQPKEHFTIRV